MKKILMAGVIAIFAVGSICAMEGPSKTVVKARFPSRKWKKAFLIDSNTYQSDLEDYYTKYDFIQKRQGAQSRFSSAEKRLEAAQKETENAIKFLPLKKLSNNDVVGWLSMGPEEIHENDRLQNYVFVNLGDLEKGDLYQTGTFVDPEKRDVGGRWVVLSCHNIKFVNPNRPKRRLPKGLFFWSKDLPAQYPHVLEHIGLKDELPLVVSPQARGGGQPADRKYFYQSGKGYVNSRNKNEVWNPKRANTREFPSRVVHDWCRQKSRKKESLSLDLAQ